jgi:hypothetical protein
MLGKSEDSSFCPIDHSEMRGISLPSTEKEIGGLLIQELAE